MENLHSSDRAAQASMQPPLRNRLIILALLCTPLLIGGALLFRSPPPPAPSTPGSSVPGMRPIASQQDGSEEMPAHLHTFLNSKPTPEGKVSLQDVEFDYLTTIPYRPFGKLSFHVAKNSELVITALGKKKPVWQGAVHQAEFLEETIAGVNTLKKVLADGAHIIWSDAASMGAPDLQLRREPDGKARLFDKKGILLWSGVLKPDTAGWSSSQQGGKSQMKAGGVQIDGNDGMYTVKIVDTNTILWSGRLPLKAVFLVRDGRRFDFRSLGRSPGETDRVLRFRFEKESGTVTITDKKSRVLGTRPIAILKNYSTMGSQQLSVIPGQLFLPDGRLTKNGTVLLTYKDSTRHIIRHVKVYKDGKDSRIYGSINIPQVLY